MWVHLVPKSENKKTGPIAVSTTEEDSCPKECAFKDDKTCYGKHYPIMFHWQKVSSHERGDNWDPFCKRVEKFENNQFWRHNQIGDLPKDKNSSSEVDEIDKEKSIKLLKASSHTKGFTYTHYDVINSEHNRDVVRQMNKSSGMTVNLSGNDVNHADKLVDLDIGPVCVTLPSNITGQSLHTPNGNRVLVCPEQTGRTQSCDTCRLCESKTRSYIIGFIAHGSKKKKMTESILLRENQQKE